LNRSGAGEKRVLLVVTDGQDNASQETLREALQKVQTKNGPVIYAIVLQGPGRRVTNPDAIRTLCQQTGGAVFFPDSLDQVSSIATAIGRDIRSQYVIGYKSSDPGQSGTYHTIQAQAWDQQGQPLRVSTRAGYYTGPTQNPQ